MKYLVSLLLILVIGGGAFLIYKNANTSDRNSGLNSEPYSPTPITNNPQPSPITPEGWQNYKNEKWGVSFSVPATFEITSNGNYSVLATPKSGKDSAGNTRFFYLSTVPENYTGDDWEIYNYNKTNYDKLLNAEVNDRVILSGNGQEDWYTYERAGDDVFNNQTAKVFLNQRPWEFPNGTWEYRYIFETNDRMIIAGAYFESGPSDAEFTLPLVTQIMNTLVLY